MIHKDIIALILCGGQSRRMGTDKGLLTTQGTAWVTMLQQALASLSLPVYVSIRADQQATYQRVATSEQLIVDGTWKGIAGPLVGILSAAQQYPNQHLLVVPCDMPKLSSAVFAHWLSAFQKQAATYQAFISRTTQRQQPLCGIYHADGLQALTQHYHQGTLQDQSMHAVLDNVLTTYSIEIPSTLTSQFANYNTPDELT